MKNKCLISVLPAFVLAGCSIQFSGSNITTVINKGGDSGYILGQSEINSPITELDIQWVTGNIKVVYHNAQTVKFYEESSAKLTDKNTIHYRLSGESLSVTAALSGKYETKDLEKDLFVFIPLGTKLTSFEIDSVNASIKSAVMGLSTDIDTVSSDIELSDSDGGNLKIDTVSGKANLSFNDFTRININTVSSDTTLSLPKDFKVNASINSISGKIMTSDVTLDEIEGKPITVDSVSGSLTITGRTE